MVFSWPARGRITSSFGNRRDPFTRTRRFHSGIDISLDPGTPIFAAANGTVIFSGWKEGYGNTVVLKHERGYITVYAHNSSNGVPEGETVKQGQQIALSGMTGLATGPHLHYELYRNGTPVNPLSVRFTVSNQVDANELVKFKARLAELKAVKPGAAMASLAPRQAAAGAPPQREIDRLD